MINCPGFPETGQFLGTHDLYNWESLSKLKGVGYPLSKSSFKGFPGSPEVKNLPANSENTVNRWSGKIPQQFSSVAQLCPTLCDPIDHSTSGLPIITNSRSLPKPMSIESVMPSNHLILCCPLLHLPSIFPISGSFQMSQLFTSGGQSIGVSASTSVLLMNTQDWSPLGWTGWISLQSKGLLRAFSNTTVQKHQFFGTQLSL